MKVNFLISIYSSKTKVCQLKTFLEQIMKIQLLFMTQKKTEVPSWVDKNQLIHQSFYLEDFSHIDKVNILLNNKFKQILLEKVNLILTSMELIKIVNFLKGKILLDWKSKLHRWCYHKLMKESLKVNQYNPLKINIAIGLKMISWKQIPKIWKYLIEILGMKLYKERWIMWFYILRIERDLV